MKTYIVQVSILWQAARDGFISPETARNLEVALREMLFDYINSSKVVGHA